MKLMQYLVYQGLFIYSNIIYYHWLHQQTNGNKCKCLVNASITTMRVRIHSVWEVNNNK